MPYTCQLSVPPLPREFSALNSGGITDVMSLLSTQADVTKHALNDDGLVLADAERVIATLNVPTMPKLPPTPSSTGAARARGVRLMGGAVDSVLKHLVAHEHPLTVLNAFLCGYRHALHWCGRVVAHPLRTYVTPQELLAKLLVLWRFNNPNAPDLPPEREMELEKKRLKCVARSTIHFYDRFLKYVLVLTLALAPSACSCSGSSSASMTSSSPRSS